MGLILDKFPLAVRLGSHVHYRLLYLLFNEVGAEPLWQDVESRHRWQFNLVLELTR